VPVLHRTAADGPRKPVVWVDLASGKFHAVNNETGEEVPTDRDGRPVPQFHHNISGVASTKTRLNLRLKVSHLAPRRRAAAPMFAAPTRRAAASHRTSHCRSL
jgi:hypothetical protein